VTKPHGFSGCPHTRYEAPVWQGWQRLGGTPTTGPGGTSSGPTRLEIACRSGEFIHFTMCQAR
jgi:hypothetical protein